VSNISVFLLSLDKNSYQKMLLLVLSDFSSMCLNINMLISGVMVMILDLQSRDHGLTAGISLLHNDSGQVVHTCASVTKQYNLIVYNCADALQLWL